MITLSPYLSFLIRLPLYLSSHSSLGVLYISPIIPYWLSIPLIPHYALYLYPPYHSTFYAIFISLPSFLIRLFTPPPIRLSLYPPLNSHDTFS